MKTFTSTKTKTVTNTQLAIAVLALLGAGAFAFAILPPLINSNNVASPTCALVGDLNGNGTLDAQDQTAIADIIAGKKTSNVCADMDGDGVVAPADLTAFKLARAKQDRPACADSDGGLATFYSGYVTVYDSGNDTSVVTYDACRDTAEGSDLTTGKLLIEAGCSNDALAQTTYTCPNGCKNRMCIPSINDGRKFVCQPKPELGTEWNTVSYYEQKWSGTKWLPTGSQTQYNTISSATACRFKCASGFEWDGSQCLAVLNGNLTVKVDASTPAAKALVASSTGNEVVKYKFSATNESIDITKLNVFIGDTTDSGTPEVNVSSNISYVSAYVDNNLVGTAVPTNASGNMSINIDAGAFRVDPGTPKILTLKVDMYDKNQLITGTTASTGAFKVGLAEASDSLDTNWDTAVDEGYNIIATGVSSGQTIDPATINQLGIATGGRVNGGSDFSAHDGILQVSLNASSPSGAASAGTATELLRFNLKAVNDEISLNVIQFVPSEIIPDALPAGTTKIQKSDSSITYGTVAGACDVVRNFGSVGTAWTTIPVISAGQTLVLKFVCNTTGALANTTMQESIQADGGLTKAGVVYAAVDGVAVGTATDVTITDGLPLNGNVLRF